MVADAREDAPIELRGPMADFGDLPYTSVRGKRMREVLFHSKAGSGKTVGIAAQFVEWCRDHPGTRILILRKTLKALRESWQVTFEELVAPRYGIPVPTSSRKSRENYKIGKSEIVLGGLDDPEKWRSTEWNIVWFVEMTEVEESDFEEVSRGLRWSKGVDFHFKGGEVNPKSQFHWIYNRFFGDMNTEDVSAERRIEHKPGRVAFRPTLVDNPHYWDAENECLTKAGREFEENLDTFTGARHRQMAMGDWCVDDGLVYPDFSFHSHVFDGGLRKDDAGTWWIDIKSQSPIRIIGFFHSQDWGIDKPGVNQIWAVDEYQRICLVREWYHTGWDSNRWAGIHVAQVNQLGTKWIICDGAAADSNAILRKTMARNGGGDGRGHVVAATGALKDKLAGRQLVGSKLREMRNGMPCIYFLSETLQHQKDPRIKSAPSCTIKEFPGYIMKVDKSGMSQDEPVKKNDHGMDAMKYGVLWFFNHPFVESEWVAQGFHHTPWMDENDPLDEEIMDMYREQYNDSQRGVA